ncbi:MAG: anion permease [Oscillospiraceae bacterium]|nr:anion permease [Oscillospiraceae bacterium]
MTFQLIATLVIMAVTIILFASNKVGYGMICMFIMVALSVTGALDSTTALATFGNNNVVLFGAMFVVGAGIAKTGLVQAIARSVYNYKDSPKKLVAIVCVAGAIISALVNTVVAVPVLLPIIIEISKETGYSRSKLLFPMTVCVNAAAGATIMGIGAMNPISNNMMMQAGGTIPLRMIDFTIARTPFVIIAILYMVFIGYKLLPNRPESDFEDIQSFKVNDAAPQISETKRKIAIVITVLTVIALFAADFIGIPAWITAVVSALLFVAFGIVSSKEAYASIHWPTMFLFVGVLALNSAMTASGAAQYIGDQLTAALHGNVNPYVVLLVLTLVILILTQFMSNMIIVVFAGVVTMVCVQLGMDPRAAVMAIQVAGCASILTPMASPVQAMIAAPGKYAIKDFVKCGLPLCIIDLILLVIFMPMLFPFYP